MGMPYFCINYYMKKKKFDVDKFLDLFSSHKIIDGKYFIYYGTPKIKASDHDLKTVKIALKNGLAHSFEAYVLLKEVTQPIKNPGESYPAFCVHVSLYEWTAKEINPDFHESKILTHILYSDFQRSFTGIFSKEGHEWLFSLFRDLIVKLDCVYAYCDFDDVSLNSMLNVMPDGTFKVIENKEGETFTPAIFNEISYFSKEVLDQNNNREFILSKDLGRVIELENGGIIVIDKKTCLKELLKENK